jgi:RimJ/RimL family protein N-acetyltransferase
VEVAELKRAHARITPCSSLSENKRHQLLRLSFEIEGLGHSPGDAIPEEFHGWGTSLGTSLAFAVESPASSRLVGIIVFVAEPDTDGRVVTMSAASVPGLLGGVALVEGLARAVLAVFALGVTRVQMDVLGSNARMRTMASRMGVSHEGCRRSARYVGGRFEDVHRYALTAAAADGLKDEFVARFIPGRLS